MNTCKVEGCNKQSYELGFCSRHYGQYHKFGYILKRTTYDKNEIVLTNEYAEILLYKRNTENIIARAKIDISDIEKCKKYKWRLVEHEGYKRVRADPNHKTLYLHQLILNSKNIDHINGDTLDNRKINLRQCSQQENCFNQKINKTNTSGYKGVSYHKKNKKYRAYIVKDNKQIYLGLFVNKEEAYNERIRVEKILFGEFRRK